MASPFRPAHQGPRRLLGMILEARAARPLRFAITGGLSGLFQLLLLKLLLDQGRQSLPANAVAFLLAAQLNFVLSTLFTWRDRVTASPIWQRWLVFHGSIATMALVNMLVFAAAHEMLPDLAAAAAGIGAAALGNFFIGDRLVFRAHTWCAQPGIMQDAQKAAV